MNDYGIHLWSDDNFHIQDSDLIVNYKSSPSLLEITQKVRAEGVKGPLLLRFPHLIHKQIDTIYTNFNRAIKENNYSGNFHALFPLKVNQYPDFVKHIILNDLPYAYGLEAGSKAELILAMSLNPLTAPLTVNGFKDREMVSIAFIASQMGHDITITIEGLNELEMIIDVAQELGTETMPNIGIRMRLHSGGSGIWAKSGGIASKFGLTATELIEAMELIKSHKLLDKFTMLHFHIGSQLKDINPLKKALREVGNIYAELVKMGAKKLKALNLGGGLAIEYSQHENSRNKNYTMSEFSNDVVFLLKTITQAKGVKAPDIYTESGRFIAAPHAMLITPVLELFSHDYQEKSLKLKDKNPPLITELNELYILIKSTNAKEFLHDALDHMESLLTLFDLGYIDLIDRSNAEILTHLIIKKALKFLADAPTPELQALQSKLQERYLVNSSFFQSIPDFWGLSQHFPIMPIHNLNTKATRSATLWDISCDSDGEIPFDDEQPLFLHDINTDEEEYFLGFFLIGAYQEVLGMKHNLFTRPTEVSVDITDEAFTLSSLTHAENILSILEGIGYESANIVSALNDRINNTSLLNNNEKHATMAQLKLLLEQNGYLRTTN